MAKVVREEYEERILLAQMYIWRHLDEPLCLDEIAKAVSFSPFHFHRLFAAMTGESIGAYVRRLRLERTALELRYGPRTVPFVAQDAGYETQEAFTKAFRRHFGVPPGAYRRGARSSRDPAPGSRQSSDTGGGSIMNEVTVRNFPPITVAFIRYVGPYAECGAAWEKLCGYPGVQKTFGPDTRFIGICYDDPDVTEADKLRCDVCVSVPEGFVPDEGLSVQRIAGGDYGVYVHTGPYSGLHEAYRRLYGEWIPECGREVQYAPTLEVYLDDCSKTPPEKLRTEIRIPLK